MAAKCVTPAEVKVPLEEDMRRLACFRAWKNRVEDMIKEADSVQRKFALDRIVQGSLNQFGKTGKDLVLVD